MADTYSRSIQRNSPYWESLCILPLLIIHRLCYSLVGTLLSRNSTDYGPFLITAWDLKIPYIPIFVLPYMFTWVYGGIVLLYVAVNHTYERQTFRCIYLSILVMTAVDALLWYSFPASISIRVPVSELANSGWLGALTSHVYEKATLWNVIPSAHIGHAYLIWLLSKHFAIPGQRWLFLFLFILTGLSVVFIKNHYLVDVAGGMLLGHLIYMLVFLPAWKGKLLESFSTTTILGIPFALCALTVLSYLMIMGTPWN